MDPREGYQATLPQPAVVQPSYPPPPLPAPAPAPGAPPRWSATAIVIVIAVLLVGVGIGLAIGHGSSQPVAIAPAAAIDLGHLGVTSQPVDGNVLVDGRFAGVAPIERLDLDAGKHSVVIDAFGFQPYSGTLVIEARGKLNLSVLLAPLGTTGATSGSFSGAGKATRAVVPASALLPAGPAAPTPLPDAKKPARHAESSVPSPPRRDCDGEKSGCTDNCRSASTDCDFSCPGCSSCNTSVGWDECKRQCDTCRGSCANNTKFCESSCETQHANCEASQR
ncbi:MAG: PEGA domain-containing protein [Deltaproteobacteria bacterium]